MERQIEEEKELVIRMVSELKTETDRAGTGSLEREIVSRQLFLFVFLFYHAGKDERVST